jgi:hypothetical protein
MACLRLVTFFPLRPLRRLPRLRRRIADFTALPAPLLYRAMSHLHCRRLFVHPHAVQTAC